MRLQNISKVKSWLFKHESGLKPIFFTYLEGLRTFCFDIVVLFLAFIYIIKMPLKYKYTASTKHLQCQGHLPMILNWYIWNICYLSYDVARLKV